MLFLPNLGHWYSVTRIITRVTFESEVSNFHVKNFNISCNAGLVVVKFLSLSLSKKALISPSYPKDNFAGYILLGWCFSFSISNISFHSWSVGLMII